MLKEWVPGGWRALQAHWMPFPTSPMYFLVLFRKLRFEAIRHRCHKSEEEQRQVLRRLTSPFALMGYEHLLKLAEYLNRRKSELRVPPSELTTRELRTFLLRSVLSYYLNT